jgi:hypothetical protein
MTTRPFVTRQRDRIDQTTGLPLMASALADLPKMIRENVPERLLGVIALAIVPDSLLFRQSTDSIHKLRIMVSHEIQATVRPQDRVYSLSQREWLIIQPNLLSSAAPMLAMIRLRDKLMAISGAASVITFHGWQVPRWPANGGRALLVQRPHRPPGCRTGQSRYPALSAVDGIGRGKGTRFARRSASGAHR